MIEVEQLKKELVIVQEWFKDYMDRYWGNS